MAESYTATFGFTKYDKYDKNWHSGLNQNWDDLDAALSAIVERKLLHVAHEETAGTDGGDIAVTWSARPLNTVRVNRISGASLGSDQITLPAGKYRVRGFALAYACDNHRAVLYNVTDAVNQVLGSSARAKASYYIMSPSYLEGEFVIGAEKVFEVRQIAETPNTGSGLGKHTNLDGLAEIFASLEIEKLEW